MWNNKNVLITGGASGIGKLMGELFLKKGANLIIWDIDEVGLDACIQEFKSIGTVRGYVVDLSRLNSIEKAAREVLLDFQKIDVLINNAGIVVGKYFHEHTNEDIAKTMAINANAPMFTTLQFINSMMDHNCGFICNITSSAGLTSNPKMSAYVASKWAATGWSDSLRIEMKKLDKNIHVTTVTPYYINTGMFDGVKSGLVPILDPNKVAAKIVKGIENQKFYVSMPWSFHFVRFMQGLLPVRWFDFIVGDVMGIYKSMDEFKGR